jgi:hypothetical protein
MTKRGALQNTDGEGKVIYIPGHVWHITHRCHKREFLLKVAKDRGGSKDFAETTKMIAWPDPDRRSNRAKQRNHGRYFIERRDIVC